MKNVMEKSMNWYNFIKQSMPLPKSTGIPEVPDDPRFEDWGKHNWYTVDLLERNLADPSGLEEKYPDLQYLGSGAYGVAYDIMQNAEQSGHVLKVTKDISEWTSGNRIMELQNQLGGQLPNIATIYDVQKLQDETDDPDKPYDVYAIEVEQAEQLAQVPNELVGFLRWFFTIHLRYLRGNPQEVAPKAWDFILEKAPNNYGKGAEEKLKSFEPIFADVFSKYFDMASTLVDMGFSISDSHGDNVGIRHGTEEYVIFDFGEMA